MSKVGVKFDDAHSYDTWGLRLKAIHIGTPEVKTAYVDIPGRMGRSTSPKPSMAAYAMARASWN